LGHTLLVTDETTRGPVAGWYADPYAPGELRYWDGAAWGEQARSSARGRTGVPRPVGRGFAGLGGAVGILLGLTMVVLVADLVLSGWGFLMFEDAVASGDVNAIETFDGLDVALGVMIVVGYLATGICWMVWQYQLARSAPPSALRRGPGMHSFSWIIPIVTLWFPYQNIKDLWNVNAAAVSRAVLAWWWVGWLVSNGMDRIVAGLYTSSDSVSDFRTLMVVRIIAGLLALATAVLAIRILRTLTAGGLARAAGAAVTQEGSSAAG